MLKKDKIIKRLEKLPRNLLSVIYLCRDLAKTESIGVYLVGGFVRDLLLGVENLDLDIVVEKDGINFAHKLSSLLGAHLTKHRDFGTATITKNDVLKIDIATSRREFYPKPAALPYVRQGGIEDDLFRRDFTINAMACHIDFEKFGQLVDLFGGIRDLEQGRVRFLHDKSFVDDPTRIIRAVRFEQRFGFAIEPKTLRFIKEAKRLKMLEKVSRHRIRDELILMFREKKPYKVINRLNKIYNLNFIDREIRINKDTKKVFYSIDRTNEWFKSGFQKARGLEVWLMYLMFFLFSLKIRRLCRFIKIYAFNRSQAIRIVSFKKEFNRIDRKLSGQNLYAVKLHSILSSLSYEVILTLYAVSKRNRTKQKIREFFQKHHHHKLYITGGDLLLLGVKPGPAFKEIFKSILQAKINGIVSSHREELELARKIIASK